MGNRMEQIEEKIHVAGYRDSDGGSEDESQGDPQNLPDCNRISGSAAVAGVAIARRYTHCPAGCKDNRTAGQRRARVGAGTSVVGKEDRENETFWV